MDPATGKPNECKGRQRMRRQAVTNAQLLPENCANRSLVRYPRQRNCVKRKELLIENAVTSRSRDSNRVRATERERKQLYAEKRTVDVQQKIEKRILVGEGSRDTD